MGVALQNGTVHEGAGVSLVRVAADILDVRFGRLAEGPFAPGREARAAAAAKARGQHGIDDLVLGHGGQDLVERLVAVQRYILFNILRVDDAAVLERNAHLLGIEIRLAQGKDLAVLMHCLGIEEILADLALDDVLVDNPLGALGRSLRIEGTLGINDHDGAQRAQAKAARLHDEDVGQVLFLYLGLQGIDHLVASGRGAARAAADQDLLAVGGMLRHLLGLGGDQPADHDQLLVFPFNFIEPVQCHCHGLHLLIVGINDLYR